MDRFQAEFEAHTIRGTPYYRTIEQEDIYTDQTVLIIVSHE